MDFNINLFTSPYDQYHIGPNLVPYTTNLPNVNNNLEGFSGENNLSFIDKLNNSRMDNQRLVYSSEIVNPNQVSHLTVLNNQPSYGFNRQVGQWLPDYNLEDQTRKEINRNKKEYVSGDHITNSNFGNYPRNIYHFPFNYNSAERILNLNSDGLSKALLKANQHDMNYGLGYASGSTDVNATHPILKNGTILSNGIIENPYLNNKQSNYNYNLDKIDKNCNNCHDKNCIECQNNQLKNQKEGFKNQKNITELLNNNHFLWILIIILIFICLCQYNDNKKIVTELFKLNQPVNTK